MQFPFCRVLRKELVDNATVYKDGPTRSLVEIVVKRGSLATKHTLLTAPLDPCMHPHEDVTLLAGATTTGLSCV